MLLFGTGACPGLFHGRFFGSHLFL